jgi:SAM-dependent methyltransferase
MRIFKGKSSLNRGRNEDPYIFREKVLNDNFLHFVYRKILETCIEKLEIGSTEQLGVNLIELGSAGGITATVFPEMITSDIRVSPGLNIMVDAMELPFKDNSIDGIIAKDILHHVPNPEFHFSEIDRALKHGARIVYIEPNWNLISRFVFTCFHPENFDLKQKDWVRESRGPMDSNQALAKIVFERDLNQFNEKYPRLKVQIFDPIYGISFLLAGGVYSRSKIPSSLLIRLFNFESRSKRWLRIAGLNRLIVIEKTSGMVA